MAAIRPSAPRSVLFLKHHRGAPAAVNDVPMEQWTPAEIQAHIQYMNDFAARLQGSGEFVDGQALAPAGAWVRPIHEWLEVRPF